MKIPGKFSNIVVDLICNQIDGVEGMKLATLEYQYKPGAESISPIQFPSHDPRGLYVGERRNLVAIAEC